MAVVSLSEARMRAHELLLQAQVSAEYARMIEDHLLGNEVLGKASHGIVRFPVVLQGIRKSGVEGVMKQVAHRGQSRTFDAQKLPGIVAMTLATQAAVDALNSSDDSMAAVAVTNYDVVTGVLGRYAFEIAESGYIGVVMANSWAAVAPPGGRQPMIGTNPIAVAVPTNDTPVVVDVTTAATPYGKALMAKAKGESLEEGLVIDAEGNPSRDPDDADNGAILGLGDHKGFSLGLAVELLAGGLVGADIASTKSSDRRDGAFLLGIRPASFGDGDYTSHVSDVCKAIVESETRPGHDRVRLPGDGYQKLREPNTWPETVEVPDVVWDAFLSMGKS